MKKKITLLFSIMLMAALMLGACGTDPTTTDYNGVSYDELKTEMQSYLYNVTVAMPDFLEQQGITMADLEDENNAKNLVSNYGVPEELISPAIQYYNVAETYGECTNFTYSLDDSANATDPDDIEFSVTKAGSTLTTGVKLILKKGDTERKVDFQIVYNYNTMSVTGITVEPVQSLSEKMAKAGLNTLISMCIVFVVLILISLIIYAFNIFPYLEAKKKGKAGSPAPAQAPAVKVQPPTAAALKTEAPVTDDTELIAVIAAAIAASTGTSTNDFVVRSIKRR